MPNENLCNEVYEYKDLILECRRLAMHTLDPYERDNHIHNLVIARQRDTELLEANPRLGGIPAECLEEPTPIPATPTASITIEQHTSIKNGFLYVYCSECGHSHRCRKMKR